MLAAFGGRRASGPPEGPEPRSWASEMGGGQGCSWRASGARPRDGQRRRATRPVPLAPGRGRAGRPSLRVEATGQSQPRPPPRRARSSLPPHLAHSRASMHSIRPLLEALQCKGLPWARPLRCPNRGSHFPVAGASLVLARLPTAAPMIMASTSSGTGRPSRRSRRSRLRTI